MTTLIQCHGLTHRAGTKALFSGLDFTIDEGDRIGLVGHNGSGKSTLLSLLAGNVEPDSGDVVHSRALRLEVVEQFIRGELLEMSLFDALAEKLPAEERDYTDYKATVLLEQLGFEPQQHGYRVADLSGGQQNRLMFARAMISEPNLVLFDEPTNHLDLRTLLFFETFLKEMSAGFLLISHDREFLDAVTNRTLFLRDEQLYSFALPFSAARDRLIEQDEAAAARRASEEKKIDDLKVSAKRLAVWGKVYDNEKLAAKAKSMEKRIEKLEEEKTFVTRGSGLKLELDVAGTRANRMLAIEDHDICAPDGTRLFHIKDLFIRPGDRVALLGHNGAGKTTLIDALMRQYDAGPEGRDIRFNPQSEVGYYDQELALLDPALTLTETLRRHCPGSDNTYKSALIKAGFPYRDLTKHVAVLSGGEKARLVFLIIKLNQPNFLILDEPTNHIDIQGKEELEAQILEAGATVLITSHDRRFVDTIAGRYLLIAGGRLQEINDPREFYSEMERGGHGVPVTPEVATASATSPTPSADEDAMLARLVELEQLLADDRERKPRFQKPKLQAEWQAEIDELSARLDALP